jgi:hypothetical protein
MAASRISRRGRLVLLAAIAALLLGLLWATGFAVDLMTVMPALATVAIFFAWPYPGLDLIMRIAARRRRPRPERAGVPGKRRRRVPLRGGRLLAVSLGGRAPPALYCRS